MNAYSILHNYDQPLYSPDFNFINAALSYKQEKLDNNRAKLQNMYDQFPKLQVAKGVDKQYIESRLQQVRQISSKYEMLDLSDDTLASSLLTNAAQIFDDKVKEAVVSTKRMEIEDTQWAEALKKADGKYNQTYHEYALAMSDRQRYLSTQEAGDRYRGGADFIAYTGTEKKVAELTAKAAEQLKQKAFESRGSGGYFNYQDTYEFTDKNTLRQIVESSLDDNDKRHFQIMGWKQFQGVDDNALKSAYSDFNKPKIENTRENISSLEVLSAKATGEQKELIDREIESQRQSLLKLEDRYSEDSIKNKNRSSMETEMFYEYSMDNAVSPYATKRLIDREIDQVQKANVEFAEKLKQQNFDNALALSREERLARKDDLEIMKLERELGIDKDGNKVANRFMLESDDPITYDETNAGDGIQLEQKKEFEAIKNLNDLVGIGVSPGDYKELAKKFSNLQDLAESGGSINIKGQNIKVNESTLPTLLAFKNSVLDTSASRKEYRKALDNGVMKTIWQLSKVVANKGDMTPEELPNFSFEVVEKNGSLVKRDIKARSMGDMMQDVKEGRLPKTSVGHNYAYLLKLAGEKGFDNLTKGQKASLKMYTTMHIIADPKLGLKSAEKREYFYTMRDNTLKDMDYAEFSKIAKDYKEIEAGVSYDRLGAKAASDFGTQNKGNKWFDDKISAMFPGGVPFKAVRDIESLGAMYRQLPQLTGVDAANQKKAIQAKEEELRRMGGLVSGNRSSSPDYYLSQLQTRDLDYKNKKDVEINFSKDISDIIEMATKVQTKSVDEDMKKRGDLLSFKTVSFANKDSDYEKLKGYADALGIIPKGDKFKDQIQVQLVPNGQNQSTEVAISVRQTQAKDGMISFITPQVKKVSVKDFQEQTGILMNNAVRTDYSDKFGTSAAKIDLGTGIPKNRPKETTFIPTMVSEVMQSARNVYEDKAQQDKVKGLLDEYLAGKYSFKAEVLEEGQPYYISVYKNGKFDGQVAFPDAKDGGIKEFSYEDVSRIYTNSSSYAVKAFQQYVYSIYPELQR
jgi:hypothetical protein